MQDDITGLFSAMVWQPDEPYRFRYSAPERSGALLIDEVHVGMAQEDPVIGSFLQFKENILLAYIFVCINCLT